MDYWPAGHRIGVFLSVDGDMKPIGTARKAKDVPVLLRHLAAMWEELGSLPIPETITDDVLFADLIWDGLPSP